MASKVAELESRLGFGALPAGSPDRGVVLDWTAAFAGSFLKEPGWSLLGDTMVPLAPGEAQHTWTWGHGQRRLTLTVVVSSEGSELARKRLVLLATANMMVDVPYVRGPWELGDVSAIDASVPAFTHVLWAFRNVCLSLGKTDDPDTDVMAIAQAMQGALAQHLVPRLLGSAPQVDRVELSPAQVRAGDPISLTVRMKAGEPERDLTAWVHAPSPDVPRIEQAGLTLKLRPATPGHKEVTLLVADRSTLLSASVRVAFDVTSS